MNTKSLLVLVATMFATSFTSCSNDLIEQTPDETKIQTKSGEDGAYNTFFPNDPVDYVSLPLVYVDGLDFHRAEIRFNDYEVPDKVDPDIHGYYSTREEMSIGERNETYVQFGITCITEYVEHNKISYKLKNIPNGGYLVIHTFSHHKNGNVYDRYIEVPLSNW